MRLDKAGDVAGETPATATETDRATPTHGSATVGEWRECRDAAGWWKRRKQDLPMAGEGIKVGVALPGPMECGLTNPARAGMQQRQFAPHPPWSPWHCLV